MLLVRYRIGFLKLVVIVSLSTGSDAYAALTFGLQFTANATSLYDAATQQLFQDGLNFWDDIIDGHRDEVSRNWVIEVDAFNEPPVDGGILLGSAGPSSLAFSGVVADAHTSNSRFIISTAGRARFNTNPAAVLTLDTIKHEFGHALGIGTLWEDNEVYNDGEDNNSNRTLAVGTPGQYVGQAALAAYRNEFVGQENATFIPVELGGGEGTAHGHWDEQDNFGQSNTGIVDHQGRDLRFELMTGYAAPGDDFLAEFTRQALFDIGFTLHAVAVPEPNSLMLLASLAIMSVALRGRNSRRQPLAGTDKRTDT
ncbi:PEP-CTERM sorting domain-containing protein [Neorhodopirellula pilleata]|uniref:Ice-binding protein C-terminal domain-containing protein n=1 Tax=Neorhodopirellula pilleata TaxID=2714738 RepID=A0A5C6AX90_9BACT|nr:PEP-CTERM sorting domain-containing protein [Neorhodopirellula pilleata]TWU04091.1 hypothetical protein Pla100_10270 [Neorhodopirellula pilleata]